MKPVKIEFQRDPVWEFIEPIIPASKALPKWYKDAGLYLSGDKDYTTTQLTFKGCPAILDSMLQGYILPLWTDIYVEPTGGINEGHPLLGGRSVPKFSCGQTNRAQVVESQHPDASRSFEPFKEMSTCPVTFKFNSPWILKTPKDYSMLCIPPMNNRDSRFEAVAGIICSDEFTTYINIPFIWKAPSDYEGIIKQGTPLVQMIPFKREEFKQEIGFTTDDGGKLLARQIACARKVGSVFGSGYRRFFQKTLVSR